MTVAGRDGAWLASGTGGGAGWVARAGVGLAVLTVAGLVVTGMSAGAHAGGVPAPAVTDPHGGGPGHGHGGPSPTPTPTGVPTPVPTSHAATQPPASPPGSASASGAAGGPPGPGVSAGGVVPPAGAPAAVTAPINPPVAGDESSPGDVPGAPAPYAPAQTVTPGPDATDAVPVAGIAMPVWPIVAAGVLFVLMGAAGVVLVLRHRDRQSAAEGGLSILDSADPPAGATFS